MMKDLQLIEATIRMREKDACPASIVAEKLAELVGQTEVNFQLSESTSEGWRSTLIEVPTRLFRSDIADLNQHSEILSVQNVLNHSESSYIFLDMRDRALNDILKLRGIFQKVTRYEATVGYEDFDLWVYPPRALEKVVDSLDNYGTTYMIKKELKEIEEMPVFKFPVQAHPTLTSDEIHILSISSARGYFDVPRPDEAKLESLAKELGMGKGRLSERLRQIMRKVSTSYFDRFVNPI